jgi:hypothetical protein
MTNADVPAIAMGQVIENPVNPFAGKKITNDAKMPTTRSLISPTLPP